MYLGLLPQRDVGLFVCAKEPHRIGEEGGESGDERTRLELEAHLLVAAFQSRYI